jgi:hypothetical protein
MYVIKPNPIQKTRTHAHISDKKHCANFMFNPLAQTIFVIYNL